MKLHDLRPAPGSNPKRRRVGRGIASGQGKTAGRGTKGQKARAGGSIPAWFEGGQTPLHVRIPKLRGFRNPFKIDYEVVNVGAIGRLADLGVLESGEMPGAKKSASAPAPITVNQEILRAAGLVRNLNKPMKILGNGDVSVALFVVADAITKSARAKIEAAGGTVSLLEIPTRPLQALGLSEEAAEAAEAAEAEPGHVATEAVAPAKAAPAKSAPAKSAPAKAAADPKAPARKTAKAATAADAPKAAASARSSKTTKAARGDAGTAAAPAADAAPSEDPASDSADA